VPKTRDTEDTRYPATSSHVFPDAPDYDSHRAGRSRPGHVDPRREFRARDYVALEAASIIIHLAELFARHLRPLRSIFNFTFADRDRLTWLQIAFILGAFDGDK